jgi:hypothetical protein
MMRFQIKRDDNRERSPVSPPFASGLHWWSFSRRLSSRVACSKEPEKKPEHRDYGSGIASMSMVQRNLEATRRPAPAPAPVEVGETGAQGDGAGTGTAGGPRPKPRPRPRKPAAAAATHAVPAPVIEPAPVTTDVRRCRDGVARTTIVPPPAPAAVAPAVVRPDPGRRVVADLLRRTIRSDSLHAMVTELSGSGTSTLLSTSTRWSWSFRRWDAFSR